MRKLVPLIILFALTACGTKKASLSAWESTNQKFDGAVAGRDHYSAIYQLDTDDRETVLKAFRNIKNAMEDSRLKGKLKVELIAFSAGTKVMLKGSIYEAQLRDLLQKGVIIAQCNNSLIEQGLGRSQLYPFIALVPSGNGELIIRDAEGWAIIKP